MATLPYNDRFVGCSMCKTASDVVGYGCSAFVEPGVIVMILIANGNDSSCLQYHFCSKAVCSDPSVILVYCADNGHCVSSATVGVVTETNAEKAIEELKAYEVRHAAHILEHTVCTACIEGVKRSHHLVETLRQMNSETLTRMNSAKDQAWGCADYQQGCQVVMSPPRS